KVPPGTSAGWEKSVASEPLSAMSTEQLPAPPAEARAAPPSTAPPPARPAVGRRGPPAFPRATAGRAGVVSRWGTVGPCGGAPVERPSALPAAASVRGDGGEDDALDRQEEALRGEALPPLQAACPECGHRRVDRRRRGCIPW